MQAEEHLYCEECGYCLTGLTRRQCPECGKLYSESELRELAAPPWISPEQIRRWRKLLSYSVVIVPVLVVSYLLGKTWAEYSRFQRDLNRLSHEIANGDVIGLKADWKILSTSEGREIALKSLAENRGSGPVRKHLAEALIAIGEPGRCEALLKCYGQTQIGCDLVWVVDALQFCDTPETADFLAKVVATSDCWDARSTAAWNLSRIPGSARASPEYARLRQTIDSEKEIWVRIALVTTERRLGNYHYDAWLRKVQAEYRGDKDIQRMISIAVEAGPTKAPPD